MTFGQNLRKLREERKMSQMYLALEIGVAQTSVYAYEADRYYPQMKVLHRMCEALEVEPNALLKGVEFKFDY